MTAGEAAASRYRHPFRRYQRLALDAFERERAAGGRRVYLVLPPGAGKTVLGWEIARRAERRALVLCPNTAFQAQWLRQWQDFVPCLAPAGTDQTLDAPFTVLTYQALCMFDAEHEDAEGRALALWRQALAERAGLSPSQAEAAIATLAEADPARYRRELAEHRRRARSLVARDAPREELLDLLHPNGREIVARAKAAGPYTLVLDECHHLLEMWGYLVRALVEELGSDTLVVGLTATPPELLDRRPAALHREIFGPADLVVPTPAVVKEGDLAPYQELAYFVEPLLHERDLLDRLHERFHRLTSRLLDPDFASTPFVVWLRRRVDDRSAPSGARLGWARFEQDSPALALAALRFMHANDLDLPADARLGERHRRPPSADDWAVLVGDFASRALRPSADPRDAAAWEEIRRALPPLGYVLTATGVRPHTSPVDRVVARSGSKALAAAELLRAEQILLGDRLRALVLCDHERASADAAAAFRGVLDPQAGSAAATLRALIGDPALAALCPVLVTARTVACPRSTAVDLTTAGTTTAVHQMRGRSLRVVPQADGYYRCYLAGASAEESALFAEALDELLAPLAAPRYVIPRDVAPERPASALSAGALALRWAVGGRLGDRVVYHAVPDLLASHRSRVEAFERAWGRYVSPGRALYYRDPRAGAVIELQRGENPFALTTQIRELWR